MDYNEQINILSQQFPMGNKAAERYIAMSNGSIEKAIKLYQEEMETLFISKTQCQEKEAKKYLSFNQYQLGQAIQAYERDLYSPIEYVINRIKDKDKALSDITWHIAEVFENKEELKNNPESYTVYKSFFIVKRWMDYYGWEGSFLWDLERDMEVVCTLNRFDFTCLADKLKALRNKYEELKADQIVDIWKDSSLNQLEECLREAFNSQEEKLNIALYDFVVKNMKLFYL